VGTTGKQLPGSSKNSVSATLNYGVTLIPSYNLLLSLNGNYHSSILFNLAATQGAPDQRSSSYEIMNFTAAVNHDAWRWAAYVNNLADRQNVMAPPNQPNFLNGLSNDTLVSRPREIGVRIGYTF
jgi:outer membrane receptor protein involved in Fe transport